MNCAQLKDIITQKLEKYTQCNPTGLFYDETIKLVEDCFFLIYDLYRSSGQVDYLFAITNFIKHRTNKPLFGSDNIHKLREVYEKLERIYPTQQNDGLKCLRDLLDKYKDIRESPLIKKLYKFSMYALSLSLFDFIGISMDNFRYSVMEQAILKKKYYAGPDFIYCILDTLHFISERGYQCYLTGTLDPIMHSATSYDDWFVKAGTVIHQSTLMSNPEPHGLSKHKWLADLDENIEQGKAIYKYVKSMDKEDNYVKNLVRRRMLDLEKCKSEHMTKKAAQESRKAPLAVLIDAGSSVGKSTFMKILFFHFGKVRNLPISDEFSYTKNVFDEFYSSFSTSMWHIHLDDVGCFKPDKCPQGDITINDLIQLVNYVPYVTNQAELENKGKIPARPELVTASTNTYHLNVFEYFTCPLAVQRRLPIITKLKVKKEFSKEGQFLDSTKVGDLQAGDYPDYWYIYVYSPKPCEGSRIGQRAKYELIETFTNIYAYLDWYTTKILQHATEQDQITSSLASMRQITYCTCLRPIKYCKCNGDKITNYKLEAQTIYSDCPAKILTVAQSSTNRKVLLFTYGTYGDLDPFIRLGSELKKYGYLPVYLVSEDMSKHLVDEEKFVYSMNIKFALELSASVNNLDLLKLMITCPKQVDMFERYFQSLFNIFKIIDYSEYSYMVCNPISYGQLELFEYSKLPIIRIFPQPWEVNGSIKHMAFYSAKFDVPVSESAYHTIDNILWCAMAPLINNFRSKLGLKEINNSTYEKEIRKYKIMTLYTFPKELYNINTATAKTVGAYLNPLKKGLNIKLPETFAFVTFGSMLDNGSFTQIIKDVSKDICVVTPHKVETENVIVLSGYNNHDEIFSKATYVICHGGSGTLCRALNNCSKVGIVPIMFDQKFWAERCESTGYATYIKNYTDIISQIKTNNNNISNCHELCPTIMNNLRVFEETNSEYYTNEHIVDDLISSGLSKIKSEENLFFIYKIYNSIYYSFVQFFTLVYLEFAWFRRMSSWLYTFPFITIYANRFIMASCDDIMLSRVIIKCLGDKVHKKIGKYNFLLSISLLLSGSFIIYKTISAMISSFLPDNDKTEYAKQGEDIDLKFVGEKPKDNGKSTNVWYKEEFELTHVDIPPLSLSIKNNSENDIMRLLTRNIVRLHFEYERDNVRRYSDCNAFSVGGQYYLVDRHCIPANNCYLKIIQSTSREGVTNNIETLFDFSMLRESSTELAMIKLDMLPPKKDLTKIIALSSFKGTFDGYYVLKSSDGESKTIRCKAIRMLQNYYDDHTNKTMNMWHNVPQYQTINGDCGAALVARSEFGPVIVGIHYLKADNNALAIAIDIDQVNMLINKFQSTFIKEGDFKLNGSDTKHVLGPLHHKSPLRYLTEGDAEVYGSTSSFRAAPKSRVCKTIIADRMMALGFTSDAMKPHMKGWEPWHLNLKEMVKKNHKVKYDVLIKCVDQYVEFLIQNISQDEINMVHIYDLDTAINGSPGVTYVDKLKRNTSAGFPYKKSKRYFLRKVESEIHQDAVDINDEIKEDVERIINSYLKGETVRPVFSNSMKDEPLPKKKVDMKKIRLFSGGPMAWSISMRMLFLSSIRLIQANRGIFKCQPGTIAQSPEWEALYHRITKFGVDRIIAGDYGKYDKRMIPVFISLSFEVIIKLNQHAGVEDKWIHAMRTSALDVAFPCMEMQGDIFQLFGCEPSGHPLTVIINCIAGILYLMYAYHELNPLHEVETFFDNVEPAVYGDDNVAGISPSVPWYNHTAISQLLSTIGVEYTMPDKESESVPYMHIDDVTFLKRSFVYDENINAIVCPLDESSIHKMLLVGVKSKTVTPEHQAVASMSSALQEYFFHGKDRFELNREIFLRIIKDDPDLYNYYEEALFPTYNTLLQRFWSYKDEVEKLPGYGTSPTYKPKDQEQTSYCALDGVVTQQCKNGVCLITDEGVPLCLNFEAECAAFNQEPRPLRSDVNRRGDTKDINKIDKINKMIKEVRSKLTKIGEIDRSFKQTIRAIDFELYKMKHQLNFKHSNRYDKSFVTEVQADNSVVNHKTTEGNQEEREINVEFDDNNKGPEMIINNNFDPSLNVIYRTSAELAEFCKRPTFLAETVWSSADLPNSTMLTIDPWSGIIGNAIMRKKFDNYSYFSATLKIKVILNSTPFNYGLAMASYRPWSSGFFNVDEVPQLIQRQKVYLKPQSNMGGELTCPFFFNFNQCKIDLQEISSLGQLKISTLVGLSTVGTSSAKCNIRIYGWLEDVKLYGPTITTVQAKQGIVGKTCSAIANVSKVLELTPLEPYATATGSIATTVGAVADTFGFTNDPNIKAVDPVYISSMPNMATCDISQPLDRLSVDCRNELAVGEKTLGLDTEDQMTVSYVVGKDGLVGAFVWTSAQSSNTLIMQLPVNINVFNNKTINGVYTQYPSPIKYVADSFEFWRGDIIYNIEFVCTKFHKGRVRIRYDPINRGSTTNDSLTAGYNKVIDVGEQNSFQVRVPWMSRLPWLRCDSLMGVDPPYATQPLSSLNDGNTNGVLTVSVETELTSPKDGTPVILFVTARGAENLEFAAPKQSVKNQYVTTPQVGDGILDAPVELDLTDGTGMFDKETYLQTMGEKIVSLRQLCHRRCLWWQQSLPNFIDDTVSRYQYIRAFRHFPPFPGYSSGANFLVKSSKTPAGPDAPFNFCNLSLMHRFAAMYSAYRGSINYSFDLDTSSYISGGLSYAVYRSALLGDPYDQASALPATVNATIRDMYMGTENENTGTAATNQMTQSGLHINAPFYCNRRCVQINPNISTSGIDIYASAFNLRTVVPRNKPVATQNASIMMLNTYVGSGHDFQLLYFINTPAVSNFSTPALA